MREDTAKPEGEEVVGDPIIGPALPTSFLGHRLDPLHQLKFDQSLKLPTRLAPYGVVDLVMLGVPERDGEEHLDFDVSECLAAHGQVTFDQEFPTGGAEEGRRGRLSRGRGQRVSLIQLEGLAIRYGAIQVVQGIHLALAAGECVSVMWINGAGKSSSVKARSGLLGPASGRVVC
jgi:ABC-type multidrug transport system fused ATPase/permease subunit